MSFYILVAKLLSVHWQNITLFTQQTVTCILLNNVARNFLLLKWMANYLWSCLYSICLFYINVYQLKPQSRNQHQPFQAPWPKAILLVNMRIFGNLLSRKHGYKRLHTVEWGKKMNSYLRFPYAPAEAKETCTTVSNRSRLKLTNTLYPTENLIANRWDPFLASFPCNSFCI